MEQPVRWWTKPKGLAVAGALIGGLAAGLTLMGNPANMGLCVACFVRDIAGAIGLHRAGVVQYLRPEIPGVIIGACLTALLTGQFRSRSGSGALIRFSLGALAMIGSLVFLGCSWRVLLRMGGGDLNGLTGLAGLLAGVWFAGKFRAQGFSLGEGAKAPSIVGWLVPALAVGLAILALTGFSFGKGAALFASSKGPGSMHAAVLYSLIGGILIGGLAQLSAFCTVGSLLGAMYFKSARLLAGVAAFLVAVVVVNLISGRMQPGVTLMPIGHSNHLWNFTGMVLAGLAFTLGGGCPGRQLVLAGSGDSDAGLFSCGMLAGAAMAHNWLLAAMPDRKIDDALALGGPGLNGKIAVIVGILFCLLVGWTCREEMRARSAPADGDGGGS